jgi:acyl-CoA reductase-like NAD-dependent aldehyde dehydrogenase
LSSPLAWSPVVNLHIRAGLPVKDSINLKRVSLELGGKSPDIIFADAGLEQGVPGAAWAIFRLSGQICCGGSRLFVERKIYDRFVSDLSKFSASIVVGNGLDPENSDGSPDFPGAVRASGGCHHPRLE